MVHSKISKTTIELTITSEDIMQMEYLDLAIYAIPHAAGEAQEVFMGSRPIWHQDFLLATSGDFCEAAGFDSWDFEGMSEDDTYTLIVPRLPVRREA
jgi:hypothetical protein